MSINKEKQASIVKKLIERHDAVFVRYEKKVDEENDPHKYISPQELIKYPHGFLFMLLANANISFKTALEVPNKIKNAHFMKGDFCFQTIYKKKDDIANLCRNGGIGCRYPTKYAEYFLLALKEVKNKYGNDVSNIWSGKPSCDEVVKRFREFKGIGQKNARLAPIILNRSYKIEFSDEKFDIPIDVHVKRVFTRLGFIADDASPNDITKKARELFHNPGKLDFPVWEIGNKWCDKSKSNCKDCQMSGLCPSAAK